MNAECAPYESYTLNTVLKPDGRCDVLTLCTCVLHTSYTFLLLLKITENTSEALPQTMMHAPWVTIEAGLSLKIIENTSEAKLRTRLLPMEKTGHYWPIRYKLSLYRANTCTYSTFVKNEEISAMIASYLRSARNQKEYASGVICNRSI